MGFYGTENLTICYLSVLGYLSVVDEKTCACSINVSDPLEEAGDFVWHFPGPFVLSGHFIRCLYYWTLSVPGQITALTCTGYMVTYPLLVFLIYQSSPVRMIVAGEGDGGWHFVWRCDCRHIYDHDVVAFEFMTTCVVSMFLGDMVGAVFKLVWGLVDNVCIIGDDVWRFLWLGSCCTAWGD